MNKKVDEKLVAEITKEAAKIFGLQDAPKGVPPVFAGGIDISAVVRLVLQMSNCNA